MDLPKKKPFGIRLKSTRPSHGRVLRKLHPPEARQNFLRPGLCRKHAARRWAPRTAIPASCEVEFTVPKSQDHALSNESSPKLRPVSLSTIANRATKWVSPFLRRNMFPVGILALKGRPGGDRSKLLMAFLFFLIWLPHENGKNLITGDVHCVGEGVRARGTAVKTALERRGWS